MRRHREPFRRHLREALVEGDNRERGVVLAFLALVLFALIAFAGLAVDVGNWWWTAQKVQKAADAAAMAGVTYLPEDFPTAQNVAKDVAGRNGYKAGARTTITSQIDDRPTELRVTIETEVDNFFTGILGFKTTKIKRTAVADYAGAVPMGSPASYIGNDPELGKTEPARLQKLWINIAGRAATKISGDRYTAGACNSSVFGCTTSNNEYLFDRAGTSNEGYRFTVTVDSIQAGKDFEIQIYDPAFIYTGDHCTANMPTASESAWLQNTYGATDPFYADAAARYSRAVNGVGNDYCTGDQDISGRNLHTAYIVREPDNTPWNDLDNPVVQSATCEPVNFRPIDTPLFKYLNPMDPAYDPTGQPRSSDAAYVRKYFHRWATVCRIPAGSVKTGDYVLQVRTNHKPTTPLLYDPAVSTGGHNRFAIRAGFTSTPEGVPNGSGVKVFASGKLPIYVNSGSDATPTFHLARITPSAANRVLRLEFYDIGDVGSGGSVNMQVIPPADSGMSNFSGCVFKRDGMSASTSSNCTFTGMTSSVYNGHMVSVSIPIPAGYNCAHDSDAGCWLKVRLSFNNATPADTTTWSATIDGDPVRLIE